VCLRCVCGVRISCISRLGSGKTRCGVDREPASGRAALGPSGGDGPPLASAAGDRPAVALARPVPALTGWAGGERILARRVLHHHTILPRAILKPLRAAAGGGKGCAGFAWITLRLAMPFMSTTMSTTCSVAKERCGRGCGRGTGRAEPGGAGKGCGRRSGRVVRRFVDPPLAKAETSPASWCGGCRSGRAMAGSACICRRSRCFWSVRRLDVVSPASTALPGVVVALGGDGRRESLGCLF
jgi:hypothetical protein